MIEDSEKFFLFVANREPHSAQEKLSVSGIYYCRKMLESGPENWDTIGELLEHPNLIGALIKLTPRTCEYLMADEYATQARRILRALNRVRHIVFAHESILTGECPRNDNDELSSFFDEYFKPPSEDVRNSLRNLVNTYNLNLMPYRTNVEMSTLSGLFIEDAHKKLLFRVYVPSGRLWAHEAERFIGLFRDWLSKVKGYNIRQDGYITPHGQVYELYGDSRITRDGLSDELTQFADFLDL